MILHSASVPPGGVEVGCWRIEDYPQLRTLRADLARAVRGHARLSAEVLEMMAVVVTELATNALQHGSPPTVVRLCRTGDQLVLDVEDQHPEEVPELATGRPPGQGGLGLHLVRSFAAGVGWYTVAGTKHVWASFRSPAGGTDRVGGCW